MPKLKANALTPVAIKALVERGEVGRHADGQGLYLHVTGKGAAKWSFRFMLRGKSREMGLGNAASVSLKDARNKARIALMQVKEGKDPLAEREAAEAAVRAAEAAELEAKRSRSPERTFRAAFAEWLNVHGPAMRTERQRVQARQLMENHVFPVIGDKPVVDLGVSDMVEVLRPIWREKSETALRVRIRCEGVFAWTIGHKWRPAPNPAVWKDNLEPLLGKQSNTAATKHHTAMDWQELPAFMRRLEADGGMAALALRWTILTAVRTTESIGTMWSEIDFEAQGGPVWVVPADRAKMKTAYRVPLSTEALRALEQAKPLTGTGTNDVMVFPGGAGSRGGRIAGGRLGAQPGGLSNMAILALLRRMKVNHIATTHGFRSTFRQWVAECTSYPEAVAEMSLAHAVGNEVQRAYQRSDLLEKRRTLMEEWAAYTLSNPAKVMPLPLAATTVRDRPEGPGEVIPLAGRRG